MERRDFLKLSAAATLTLAVEPAWAQTAKSGGGDTDGKHR